MSPAPHRCFARALGAEPVMEITVLDHIFISVSDIDRSIDFYTAALAPLGISIRVDYDGKDGPPDHPEVDAAYAASVLDPDGYSLEFTYKSWRH